MRVKVLKEFIDRHTGKLHKVGETMNINKARLMEIMQVDAGLVCEVREKENHDIRTETT